MGDDTIVERKPVARWWLALWWAAGFAALAACSGGPPTDLAMAELDLQPAPREVDGLLQLASVDGQQFAVHTVSGDLTFLPGVNLGATVPGRQPGELAIDREQYRSWFPQISEAGFRVLRVYTILPPAFYEELRAYNLANPTRPLYLAHGIWIPEQDFYEARDLWDPRVIEALDREVDDAIDAINGDAEIAKRPGHASGRYGADVSPWLISLIVGVELDPLIVQETDEANPGRDFSGDYFVATTDATPSEVFLARAMDRAAARQATWGRAVPVAFVNWPTTDPLDHPTEPLATEDLVGVDANHVRPAADWIGGTFASYHAYPYYPDFQRTEPGIADFTYKGSVDPYAGYLTKLRDHHDSMPMMVTEFGVPSSVGHAHFGPLGRDQGGHSEQTSMAINAEMMTIIEDLGLAGGYVFAWIDEWFKFTWNTIDFELPADRRQLWMNPWTNEAHFGVIAAEPGPEPRIRIDGSFEDWDAIATPVIHESRDGVRQLRVTHDEGYLYLLLRVPPDWESTGVTVAFDVVPDGAGSLPLGGDDLVADHALQIGPGDRAQLLVAGHVDPYRRLYGVDRSYVDVNPFELVPGAGSWAEHTLITNRPFTDPMTGDPLPAESMIPGRLVRGTSDPDDPAFDSRTAWQADGDRIEIRLPYQGVGFSDPSSRTAYTVGLDGSIGTSPVERLGVTVAVGPGDAVTTAGYSWDPWNAVSWHQRPKAGLEELRAAADAALLAGLDRSSSRGDP